MVSNFAITIYFSTLAILHTRIEIEKPLVCKQFFTHASATAAAHASAGGGGAEGG